MCIRDRLLTGKYTGAAVFMILLAVLFWLTLEGSNVSVSYTPLDVYKRQA